MCVSRLTEPSCVSSVIAKRPEKSCSALGSGALKNSFVGFIETTSKRSQHCKTTYSDDTHHQSFAMGHAAGLRAGTRYAFSRGFKQKGRNPLSIYLKTYKVGDIVDVVANGSVQKGMPYKVYHGKTGVIYDVTKSSVGVMLYRQVGNRYIQKRLHVRVEHVRHSRSREEFLNRVKENAAKKRQAKTDGVQVVIKRQPVMPREERTVKASDNKPESITPIPYETTI